MQLRDAGGKALVLRSGLFEGGLDDALLFRLGLLRDLLGAYFSVE